MLDWHQRRRQHCVCEANRDANSCTCSDVYDIIIFQAVHTAYSLFPRTLVAVAGTANRPIENAILQQFEASVTVLALSLVSCVVGYRSHAGCNYLMPLSRRDSRTSRRLLNKPYSSKPLD